MNRQPDRDGTGVPPDAASDGRWLALVAALVLAGTALRPQALIIGPLVGEVQVDLGMSHGVAGLLRRGRFESVVGRVAFDAKGDLEGATWQWKVWTDGTYVPLDQSASH